jgi:hypothetical protein
MSMAQVIPDGFTELTYRFRLFADPEEMVVTIGHTTLGTAQATANSRADAFIAGVPAGLMDSSYTFVGVTARAGQAAGPPVVAESIKNQVGTISSNVIPNNCAYLIRKTTARGGRQGKGRMYLPPFYGPEIEILENGMLTPVALSQLQGIVEDAFPGDFFYLFHDSLSPGSTTPDAITALTVQPQIATQRRRMRP